MKINTFLEFVWSSRQNRYILVRNQSITWTGGVALCKAEGPSSEQQGIASSQQSFYNTLQKDYGTQFANQSNILNALNKSLSPIINAGVGQYGFGNAEDAAMRTQSTSGTASAYRSAKQASGEAQAAQGGGDTFIGSGVKAQTNAQLANSAASTEANQQLGITQQGYQTGRSNYFNAVNQEQNVANAYNPSAYGQMANSAGSAAYGSASNNQQLKAAADAANNPWGLVGGVAGGIAGSFVGMPGAGYALGSSLGGGLSGATSSGGNSGGLAGGFGNLDTTGGSTFMEQLKNFGSGLGR
jgi:hypothetical protein